MALENKVWTDLEVAKQAVEAYPAYMILSHSISTLMLQARYLWMGNTFATEVATKCIKAAAEAGISNYSVRVRYWLLFSNLPALMLIFSFRGQRTPVLFKTCHFSCEALTRCS
jgi:hypothetical protein